MIKLLGIIISFSIFIAFVLLGLYGGLRIIDKKGYENLEKCKTLTRGISKIELIQRMGVPFSEYSQQDYTVLNFEAPRINAEPIMVRIDPNTNLVAGIQCREGDDWK